MSEQVYRNPEPVPSASQLAVLPFVAAVDGLLREKGDVPDLRITIHRAMTREGSGYLQQACAYVRGDRTEPSAVGRVFAVGEGIMGASYASGRVWRTKHFASTEQLEPALARSIAATGDTRDPKTVALSYLAVPFLGPQNQVVLILYADCKQLNFFADDERVGHVIAMCNGFCRLFDWLQRDPFPNLRNFPLQKGQPVAGGHGVYLEIQEQLHHPQPPAFAHVQSFNYEAAVA